MINLRNIGIRFGEETLFSGVTLNVGTRERIGLVGSNGAGKTTLLRIINGDLEPDTGSVAYSKTSSVGFLPQEVVRMKGETLYDEVATAFADIIDTEKRLETVRGELTRSGLDDAERSELIEQMGALQHHLEMSDAFRMKSQIEKVLVGLGFREDQFTWMTEHFSGGWQMRIELAKLLLRQPSLLLLDEPTNHLDLHSLRWLEEYLDSYEGSLIIVSHDRAFLDRMCMHIWEVSLGKLTAYTGNYSGYTLQKEQRKELLASAFKNQQRQLKQTERFIERFRYKNTKARQVQSRIKMLDKLERIEIEDEEDEITFSFPSPPRSGAVAMDLQSIVKKYGSTEVFDGIGLTVERGDRIAFVGVNGAGKSTLAKIIAGAETPDGGSRAAGYNTIISYFAQNQAEELDQSLTPLEVMESAAQGEIRKYVRTVLGCFLFQGDDVFKSVRILSGGEKSRLALAKMLVMPANLLVLDEPTNHLDMRSKEILRKALNEFEGSYIIVSHDRAFLEGIVNKVVEFRHGGELKEYPGSLHDYLVKIDGNTEETAPVRPKVRNDKKSTEKERKRYEAEVRQKRYEETKDLSKRLNKVENEIEALERRLKELERELMNEDLYSQPDAVRNVNHEFSVSSQRLRDLEQEWESMSKDLEKINRKYDELLGDS